jgi:CMP-N,N'-diacetyllegionaminic acid synthase
LEIAEIAKRLGVEVPFLRPTELASDVSPTIDTVFHALLILTQFDSVMLLQPTSPLRRHLDIDACAEYARKSESTSVVSGCDAEPNPYWCYTI